MNETDSNELEPLLQLPQSRISLSSKYLMLKNPDGNIVATLDLQKIKKMRIKRSVSWTIGLFILVTIGIGLIPRFSSVSFPWTLILELPCGALALILFLSQIVETELVVQSETGNVVFPVIDPPADAVAFCLSAIEHLDSMKKQPNG